MTTGFKERIGAVIALAQQEDAQRSSAEESRREDLWRLYYEILCDKAPTSLQLANLHQVAEELGLLAGNQGEQRIDRDYNAVQSWAQQGQRNQDVDQALEQFEESKAAVTQAKIALKAAEKAKDAAYGKVHYAQTLRDRLPGICDGSSFFELLDRRTVKPLFDWIKAPNTTNETS